MDDKTRRFLQCPASGQQTPSRAHQSRPFSVFLHGPLLFPFSLSQSVGLTSNADRVEIRFRDDTTGPKKESRMGTARGQKEIRARVAGIRNRVRIAEIGGMFTRTGRRSQYLRRLVGLIDRSRGGQGRKDTR